MNKSPLVADRAVPLYPSLAIFLDHLPGVDKTVRKGREGRSYKGMMRALVLTQLHHQLVDSRGDNPRLYIDPDGRRWYARTYAEWHGWDFPYLPAAAVTRLFQDLVKAGIIISKSDVDFLTRADESTRKMLLRAFRIYNRKAFSIDYDALEARMAADLDVQDYYRTMFPRRSAALGLGDEEFTSDQGDQTSDQGDPTVRSGRSDPLIRVIRQSDQGDQTDHDQSLDQNPDQKPESDSSSPNPLLNPPASETASPKGGDEAGDETARPDPLDERIEAYEAAYQLLKAQGIHEVVATKLAAKVPPSLIQSWLDIKLAALRSKREGGLGVRSWPGFLIRVLEERQPPPEVEARPKTEGDWTGRAAGRINH